MVLPTRLYPTAIPPAAAPADPATEPATEAIKDWSMASIVTAPPAFASDPATIDASVRSAIRLTETDPASPTPLPVFAATPTTGEPIVPDDLARTVRAP